MQKTYCADFLTKKMVKNTGQVQQYYVEDSHPAIIEPDDFDAIGSSQLSAEKGLRNIATNAAKRKAKSPKAP